MLRSLLLTSMLGALALASSPVFADAVTYQGTLGKSSIVVELSAVADTAKGPVVGRYFYQAKGIDIPLDAVKAGGGKLDLAEEKPCTTDICHTDDDGEPVGNAPIGAKWHLEAKPGSTALTGTWTAGAKSLPVTLTRIGTRPLPPDFDNTTASLETIASDIGSGDQQLTAATSPYEFEKLAKATYSHSAPTSFGAASIEYLTDPRTKFAFPRILTLGGANAGPANAYLEQQHWQMSLAALGCEAQQFQGFGWIEAVADAVGTLGDYDQEQVTVKDLSPTVMSWEEAGSLFCGQAHPDDHDDFYDLDVRSAKPLDLSLVFNGWVPTPYDGTAAKDLDTARANPDLYSWGPDKKLEAYVKAHVSSASTADLTSEDCASTDLVTTNLGVSFEPGDKVRFGIDHLDGPSLPCGGELFTTPVAELKALLTPQASSYFPELAGK